MNQSQFQGKFMEALRKRITLTREGGLVLSAAVLLSLTGSALERYDILSLGVFLAFLFNIDAVIIALVFKPASARVRREKAPARVVLGSTSIIAATAVVTGLRILKAVLRDVAPETIEVSGRTYATGKGFIKLEYVIRPLYRGTHVIGPLSLTVPSVLGFLVGEFVFPPVTTHELDAVPTFYAESARVTAPLLRYPSPGAHPVKVKGGYGDFIKLREYVPGDDVRLIHWPATARNTKGSPLVRELMKESMYEVFIVLDPNLPTYFEYVRGRRLIDDMVDAVGGVVLLALKMGDPVGLYLAGSPALTLPPTRRREYVYAGINILEKVLPSYPTRLRSLPDVAGRFLKRGTLVLILSTLTDLTPKDVRSISSALTALSLIPIFVVPDVTSYVRLKLPGSVLSVVGEYVEREKSRMIKAVEAVRLGGGDAVVAPVGTLKELTVRSYLAMRGGMREIAAIH